VLQADKDFVEIAFPGSAQPIKFTKILSDLHMIVIQIVYTGKK
jgi:hypothetical protein